jgi:hypothetical protein
LLSSSGVTGSGASSPLTLQEAAVGTYTYTVSGVNANGTGPSSAASNSVVIANLFAPSGAYDSIATVTVGAGGSASVEFTSIPSTYKHLQLRAMTRDGQAGTGFNNNIIRFNGDTASNYSGHRLSGDGSTASAAGYANITSVNVGLYSAAAGNTAGIFGVNVTDILDYTDTNKYKTVRSLTGGDANGSGTVLLSSGNWRNTAAITSIQLSGATYAEYSSFALYGIKG